MSILLLEHEIHILTTGFQLLNCYTLDVNFNNEINICEIEISSRKHLTSHFKIKLQILTLISEDSF